MDFFADALQGLELSDPRHTGQGLVLSVEVVDYSIPDPDGLDSASFANEDGMTIVSDLDGDGRVD